MLKTAVKAGYGLVVFLAALFVTIQVLNRVANAVPIAKAEELRITQSNFTGLQPASGPISLTADIGELKLYDPSKPVEKPIKKKKAAKKTVKTVKKAVKPAFTGNRMAGVSLGQKTWDALAKCESGGRPDAVSTNGLYHGMFQFHPDTWRAVGGSGLPSQATPAEQLKRAKILQSRSGWGQWPHCSAELKKRGLI